jgi:hypothetical protein
MGLSKYFEAKHIDRLRDTANTLWTHGGVARKKVLTFWVTR